jgi:hypothetical protein
MAAKAALTLALGLPAGPRGAVEYRVLSVLPGVQAGTPVTVSGRLVGRVVATHRHAGTTLIAVRFERGARLSGSRVVALRWVGLEQHVALEIQPVRQRPWESFAHGGWLRVLPSPPSPDVRPEIGRPWAAPPDRFPSWMPTVPMAPRRGRAIST